MANSCSYDPSNIQGPIGMFHCPECGHMVVAGVPHPDYSLLEEEKKPTMAIAHLSAEDLKKMREHGHADYWEVATYGADESVTVECTKCGEVLVELVNPYAEEEG